MTEAKTRKGRRVDKSYRKKRNLSGGYSRRQYERRQSGQEENERTSAKVKQEKLRLRQLIVSALILVSVVAIKLVAPQMIEDHKVRLQELLGEDTDFVAAFSAIGRAVGVEGGIGDALSEAYTAVFGAEEVSPKLAETAKDIDVPLYTQENLPENVHMMQTLLGFPYTDPLEATLTDKFGYRNHPIDGNQQFHYGLDLEAAAGAVIRSFADGRVSVVGESSQLGKYVTVVHAGDYTTLYAHCSRITASSGQQVKMGDPIAEVGETGQATGPHLHFELYRDTTYYNPIYYVSV